MPRSYQNAMWGRFANLRAIVNRAAEAGYNRWKQLATCPTGSTYPAEALALGVIQRYNRCMAVFARWLAVLVFVGSLAGQGLLPVTTPKQALGFNLGDDYQVANYSQLAAYWKTLDAESDRMILADIGTTAEGRPQYMAIV